MILLSLGVILGVVAAAPGVAVLGLVLSPLRRWERLWILCFASAPFSLLFGLLVQLVLTIAALPPGLSTPGQFSHALPAAFLYGLCAGTGGIFSAAVGVLMGNTLRRRWIARQEYLAARRSAR
jgi:hypothetical protein